MDSRATALAFVLIWLPAVWLTDKYVHKYPQRYYTYLFASHLKAAVIMVLCLLVAVVVGGSQLAPPDVLWSGLGAFILLDFIVSAPRRRASAAEHGPTPDAPSQAAGVTGQAASRQEDQRIDAPTILRLVEAELPGPLAMFVRGNLPDSRGNASELVIVDDIDRTDPPAPGGGAGLLIGRTRLNDVHRLNQFIGHCAERVAMGGYLAVRYTPLEQVLDDLRRRRLGPLYWPAYLLHFAWYRAIPKIPWLDRLYFLPSLAWLDRLMLRAMKRRNRALPKAEAWGRLAFWGFEVVAESAGDGDKYVLAKRVSPPLANRRPSFYTVVALEKVGLDGDIIRTHKLRSMYPFSEFLQRRIHETHGLTATGKFKNDFRLTEYGKLIRRHWIDELPGLYDWLRGEIKLVGMRATSPQFLSNYPRDFYDLYIRVKPGLIPPIFDESTNGFDDIVAIEREYLTRYCAAPIRTDIVYLWYTFRDIVFRRVRSQ